MRCLSNLKQVGIASHMYAEDHENFFSPMCYNIYHNWPWDMPQAVVEGENLKCYRCIDDVHNGVLRVGLPFKMEGRALVTQAHARINLNKTEYLSANDNTLYTHLTLKIQTIQDGETT